MDIHHKVILIVGKLQKLRVVSALNCSTRIAGRDIQYLEYTGLVIVFLQRSRIRQCVVVMMGIIVSILVHRDAVLCSLRF